MFIRSDRLFLRPAWPEDWEELHPMIDDEGIVRNLARAPWPYSAQDAQAFARLGQDPMLPHFVITLPHAIAAPNANGAEIIGCAGLGDDDGQVELGYWIARRHWGNGYATEAARALLEIARMLGHRRVVAGHFHDNPASGRVLRKAGFVPTGAVCARFSHGRGEDAGSVSYSIDLGDSQDCGGGDDGETVVRMAA